MNEAGEPYMTAAQLNFEAALDQQSAEEAWFDRQESGYYDDECPDCGEDHDEDEPCDVDEDDDTYPAEDAAMEAGLFGWDA